MELRPEPLLQPGFVYEDEFIADAAFVDQECAGGVFEACRLLRVDLSGTKLRRLRIEHSELENVEASGADWLAARIAQTTIRDSRLLGIQLGDAELREVTFENCRLDMASFRGADASELELRDCVLSECELNGAKIRSSRFSGCDFADADFTQVKLDGVDLRGSRLSIARGYSDLRGAIVDGVQLVELAPALAAELGIAIQPAALD